MSSASAVAHMERHLERSEPDLEWLTRELLDRVLADNGGGELAGWMAFHGLAEGFCWWIDAADALLLGEFGAGDIIVEPHLRHRRDCLIALEGTFWQSLSAARANYAWADDTDQAGEGYPKVVSTVKNYALYRAAVCELAQEVLSPDLCEQLKRRL